MNCPLTIYTRRNYTRNDQRSIRKTFSFYHIWVSKFFSNKGYIINPNHGKVWCLFVFCFFFDSQLLWNSVLFTRNKKTPQNAFAFENYRLARVICAKFWILESSFQLQYLGWKDHKYVGEKRMVTSYHSSNHHHLLC